MGFFHLVAVAALPVVLIGAVPLLFILAASSETILDVVMEPELIIADAFMTPAASSADPTAEAAMVLLLAASEPNRVTVNELSVRADPGMLVE